MQRQPTPSLTLDDITNFYVEVQHDLAKELRNLGKLYVEMNDPKTASLRFDEAIAEYKKLPATPQNGVHLQELIEAKDALAHPEHSSPRLF